MNEIESQRKQELLRILKEYEDTELQDEKECLFNEMNKVSSIPVDKSFLDEYWRSVSAEEFCNIHSVIPEDGKNITNENITGIIELIVQSSDDIEKSDYYMLKYEEAVEFYFKKNPGSFREILWEDEEPDVSKIISKLSKPDIISL